MENEKNKIDVAQEKLEIVATSNKRVLITDTKKLLSDVLMVISWRELARTYFGKSSSWLYHKMDGTNGVGGVGGFSEYEAKQLQNALFDLSDWIRQAAERL